MLSVPAVLQRTRECRGEGVPGVVGYRVGAGRAIPVPRPTLLQDPYLTYSKAQGPTHGQMKAILEVSVRFPR